MKNDLSNIETPAASAKGSFIMNMYMYVYIYAVLYDIHNI